MFTFDKAVKKELLSTIETGFFKENFTIVVQYLFKNRQTEIEAFGKGKIALLSQIFDDGGGSSASENPCNFKVIGKSWVVAKRHSRS